MEKKKQIRKETIEKRLRLSENEVVEKSKAITEMVLGIKEYQQADTIFCYVDFRNEVKTREIIEDAWNQGKIVAVPKVVGNYMNFYQISNWQDLKPGAMKIEEPINSCKQIAEKSGFMIMPGVAFDEKRNRIGYGGGYYDKYLSEENDLFRIAIAFEVQLYDELPIERHDFKPFLVVTEERVIG